MVMMLQRYEVLLQSGLTFPFRAEVVAFNKVSAEGKARYIAEKTCGINAGRVLEINKIGKRFKLEPSAEIKAKYGWE